MKITIQAFRSLCQSSGNSTHKIAIIRQHPNGIYSADYRGNFANIPEKLLAKPIKWFDFSTPGHRQFDADVIIAI